MNLRSVDLNLLVIFDALMTEKSIARASTKVGMTPSAVSHALRRLRDTFQDELIQRTPLGMVPTRRALDLHKRVGSALAEISRAVDQQLNFDPATSERTFKLRVSDYTIACLLPRICTRVRAEAPKSTLIVEYIGDEAEREEPGELQLRICADPQGPDYDQLRLLQNRFFAVLRRDHPAATQEMTLDRFVSLPHLRVSSATIGPKLVDDTLAKRGMSRWIALTIPTLAGVMPILEHTDLCTVLPAQWVKLYGNLSRITTAPLPLPEIAFTIDLIWRKRDQSDAGHRWLRRVIEEEFAVLYAGAGEVEWTDDNANLLDIVPVRFTPP